MPHSHPEPVRARVQVADPIRDDVRPQGARVSPYGSAEAEMVLYSPAVRLDRVTRSAKVGRELQPATGGVVGGHEREARPANVNHRTCILACSALALLTHSSWLRAWEGSTVQGSDACAALVLV